MVGVLFVTVSACHDRALTQVALKLDLDIAGILALGDGDHALEQDLLGLRLGLDHLLELVGGGQKKQIGQTDAVDGRQSEPCAFFAFSRLNT